MKDSKIFPSKDFIKQSLCDNSTYEKLYLKSIDQPEKFWAEQAERIQWIKKWDVVKNTRFESPVSIKWFEGGQLNASVNCIDRHLPNHADKVALIFEADEANAQQRKITYQELFDEVNKLANVLKLNGVKKGDRVAIYLPMIPEAVFSMLACSRIGAVHSVIFGGFSPDAIADRILDADIKLVITADGGHRGGKLVSMKANVDQALHKCPNVNCVLIFSHAKNPIAFNHQTDRWIQDEYEGIDAFCAPEVMDAEDPLFLLYTSGSTSKPKGVLHTTGGYLVYASLTHEMVFDLKPDDIYFCTADVGWITGHSYVVYGPLANASTVVIFEGVPSYPNHSRLWEIVDKYKVTILYTAPTAIRALMKEGLGPLESSERSSLRVLGSVGEPINPEAWRWYYENVGNGNCPVVDTWWQTETGGILISPLPGATPLKPGSATRPFFGVRPVILTPEGKTLMGAGEGVLVMADSWPGQARTLYGDHKRFEETYFSNYKGYYFTGDGCRRDEDGYYWITGRVDDVLNVAGHRLGTAELESALVAHPIVAEAAVVGIPHDIKGQGIYVYCILNSNVEKQDLETASSTLKNWLRLEISPIATPEFVQIVPGLPKTRSGKIMRRILRKIAEGQLDQLGDTSTLADPHVVEQIVDGFLEYKNQKDEAFDERSLAKKSAA